MWRYRRKDRAKIPCWGVATIVLALLSLIGSVAAARWSWLTVEEQISLRREMNRLQEQQEQVHIQYEFWLQRLQQERENYLESSE
ncbi:hypothetical protein AMJ57_03945 [Parcubacteria bacterium SG8_24]|nr:MAG: hypothetical protein AMJ57_03945 [Parcubacteria bacterium SG8_24]